VVLHRRRIDLSLEVPVGLTSCVAAGVKIAFGDDAEVVDCGVS
jgi:hypothetical protein